MTKKERAKMATEKSEFLISAFEQAGFFYSEGLEGERDNEIFLETKVYRDTRQFLLYANYETHVIEMLEIKFVGHKNKRRIVEKPVLIITFKNGISSKVKVSGEVYKNIMAVRELIVANYKQYLDCQPFNSLKDTLC